MIDPNRVEELLKIGLSEDAAPTEGFVHSYGLSAGKLAPHRAEVIGMLDQLPEEFFDNGGGGWSALNLCQTAKGELWTGLQMRAEQLYCIAKALGLADMLLPREMWSALPGGMPYVAFNRSLFAEPKSVAA